MCCRRWEGRQALQERPEWCQGQQGSRQAAPEQPGKQGSRQVVRELGYQQVAREQLVRSVRARLVQPEELSSRQAGQEKPQEAGTGP